MKYFGAIGYSVTEETRPGVWEESITERNYYGDVLSYVSRWDKSEYQNDDLRISNRFSILADPYAYEHFSGIRYITFMNVKWKVTEITVEGRRLILKVGDVYTEDGREESTDGNVSEEDETGA